MIVRLFTNAPPNGATDTKSEKTNYRREMRHIIYGIEGLRSAAGMTFGPTEWMPIDQDRIDAFSACTGDAQWIHVDVERASAGPFGSTVAHGFLTLALIPVLWRQLVEVREVTAVLNLGLDRVRFPAPVRSGASVRGRFFVSEANLETRGLRLALTVTLEATEAVKPVCVAEAILLYR